MEIKDSREKQQIPYDISNFENDQLLKLYRAMLKPRLIEEKMLVLLRQGKISKWFSGIGQEAISIGVTLSLEKDEYILPMHRNWAFLLPGKCLYTGFSANGREKLQVLLKVVTAVSILEPRNTRSLE